MNEQVVPEPVVPVRVDGHEALVAASGGSPWVRWGVDATGPVPAWTAAEGGAVALARPPRAYGSSLTAVGRPGTALGLALALLDRPETRDLRGLTLPAATAPALTRLRPELGPGVEWEWMWTASPPAPVPGEDAVRELDVGDPAVRAAVLHLLHAVSPRHSAEPGDPYASVWVGVVGADGGLLACGAYGDEAPGVPLLASIAVSPDARGRGLGAAVTAALTRRAFADGAPVVTVDLYSDNPVARELYRRLGFVLDQEFASWTLPAAGA